MFLSIARFVALKPLIPFRQAQYVQVFLLKPTPFCTLFVGLGSTNKSAMFLLFFSYLTPVQSSYLKLCSRSGRNCLLSPVLSDYNGSPDTRFSRGTTQLMSWPDGVRYLRPMQSPVVSLLLSRTVSSKFFDTQVPSISTEELVLPVSSLVYAATDTAFC